MAWRLEAPIGKMNLQRSKFMVRDGRRKMVWSLQTACPSCGVSEHLFLEDLAKSKLLFGDILSFLFLFTPVTSRFYLTSWCNVCFPVTEDSLKTAKEAQESGGMCLSPALT